MSNMIVGAILLAAWGVLQFGVQSTSGWIHLLLAAGVVLIIRGIALSRIGLPRTP